MDCVRQTVHRHGMLGLYRGMAPLIAGTIPKVASRFAAYEQAKEMLGDENGKLTTSRTFLAGLIAGATEAIIAVYVSWHYLLLCGRDCVECIQ